MSSDAEREINAQYAGKPILTAEENKERLAKIRAKRLETEMKSSTMHGGDKIEQIPIKEEVPYPFKDQTKKEKKEPAKTLPFE